MATAETAGRSTGMSLLTVLIHLLAAVVAMLSPGNAPQAQAFEPWPQYEYEMGQLAHDIQILTGDPEPVGGGDPANADAVLEYVRRELHEEDQAERFLQQSGTGNHHCPVELRIPVENATYAGGLGWATRPADGKHRYHEGLDLSAPEGTVVYAAESGEVTFAGWRGGYGNVVYLTHSWGTTRYAHLATIAAGAGTEIKRGEVLGTVGATGLAGSPHLHFEVRHHHGAVIDPRSCL